MPHLAGRPLTLVLAPVSMLLAWREVTACLGAFAFTAATARARLRRADPWAGFESAARPLLGGPR